MYYYGVKLHVLGQKQYETLPKMKMLRISAASENDITVAKQWLTGVRNMDIFADKMYADKTWKYGLSLRSVNIFTPVKLAKGQKSLDSIDTRDVI